MTMRKRLSDISISLTLLISGCAMLLLSGCSSTKFVPEGRLLLDDVRVHVNDTTGTFTNRELVSYLRQRPNNKFLNMTKMRLGVYNLSGQDSTRWWNKWMRRMGEAPVLFSEEATENDARQLLRAVNNAGFLHASVRTDSFPNHAKKKTKLEYTVDLGSPHIIKSINYEFPNDTVREFVMIDSLRFPVHAGDRLDRNILEEQRDIVTTGLQNHGYWAFGKEYITFTADTSENSRMVDLTMRIQPPRQRQDSISFMLSHHRRYIVRNIYYIPDYNAAECPDPRDYKAYDTVDYKGVTILYSKKRYLRPSVLAENCFFRRGEIYRAHDLNNTYTALGRLSILKFINIRMVPSGTIGQDGLLDVYILLTPDRSQSFSLEVEGTNSEGDLGFALALAYAHRNVAKGSELLNVRLRGSYQALNGNLEGFIHDRFMEYGADFSLTFPKFKAPFLKESFKRRIRATTEINLSINYQERPEYTRIVSAAGWSYKWARRNSPTRYVWTPLDISYVYLPASTNDFIDQIAPDNPLLRYSYEDHFIMRAGFQFYHTTKKPTLPGIRNFLQRDVLTYRANVEIAGNLLFAINSIFTPRKNFHEDPYKVFGIRYSQYFRADGDFTYLHSFDHRNALACHVGLGVGVPYANSSILPFEKRFYGGGANGVRGWSVRTLGPGKYPATNSQSDFIHQCGDIRLNLSVEYRAKMFWVVEGALFIDAGNIWTIRDYESQPGGVFRFNQFYKQIAMAYGAGIRLDFNYFLIRFDLGMKARNPAVNQEPWPLIHPNWSRDHAFHFSIGYPF